MNRHISTYYSDKDQGYCHLMLDLKTEMFYLEYYDNNKRMFFTEEFPGKSMRYVEDAAENWALGIKEITTLYG